MSKGGACLFLKSFFEAEDFQCVDVIILSVCVEGVVELLERPFVVTDAPVLVRCPCRYGARACGSKLDRKQSEIGEVQ